MAKKYEKELIELVEASEQLASRLYQEGNIDHIREEGAIEDWLNAIENAKKKLPKNWAYMEE
jgi:hypothetical protein